jgi:hypothetical protein
MSYFFDVYGSFQIARVDGVVCRSQPALWDEARLYDEALERAIGCYLFCLAHGTSITPWYVGKTIAKGGFRDETFTDHKLDVYNGCLGEKRGRPRLFLFAMQTQDGGEQSRFSHNRSHGGRAIDWLEKTLMGMALQRNPDLWNIRDTTLPRSVTVRGIIGAAARGRPHTEVLEARRALFG